jgi:hypothetical protein
VVSLVHQTIEQAIYNALMAPGIGGHVRRLIEGCEQGEERVGDRLSHDFISKATLIDDDIKQLHAQAQWIVSRVLIIARNPVLPHHEDRLRVK